MKVCPQTTYAFLREKQSITRKPLHLVGGGRGGEKPQSRSFFWSASGKRARNSMSVNEIRKLFPLGKKKRYKHLELYGQFRILEFFLSLYLCS